MQPGILCGWSGRLNSLPLDFRSAPTLSALKNAQDIFSHVPTSLTNCFQSMSSEHCAAPL